MLLSFIDIYNKVMIYKKKHIIKESLIIEGYLLDVLNNFTSKEKKILHSLYKKYYKPDDTEFRWWKLKTFDLIEELYKKWQLPYNVAYKMAKVFVLHGDALFKDNIIASGPSKSEMLRMYSDRFFESYKKNLPEDVLPTSWNLSVGDTVAPYEVRFWPGYKGITLYMAIESDYIDGLSREERWDSHGKVVMVKINFDFEVDNPTLSLKYQLGSNKTPDVTIIEKALFDLPTEVDKPEMFVWLDDLLENQIRVVLEDFKFPDTPKY